MYELTAADFADTGQWRMTINISLRGLEAILTNTVHKETRPQTLCKVIWEKCHGTRLRNNIENAVYDNLRLLDDYSTKIVFFDPKTLFLPTSLAEENPGFEGEYHSGIYNCEPEDVMSDCDSDVTATWSFAPGIKGFISRTFPGARITCNLLEGLRKCRVAGNEPKLSIFEREEETDMILTDNGNLISAVTYPRLNPSNFSKAVDKLLDAYGYTHHITISHENNKR